MVFKSVDDIKSYIIKKSETAIRFAQERVFLVINRFVKEYYAEYSPVLYERTYQLFKSLVKSDIKRTSNGWIAEVYFDIDKLDYHMKKLHGKEVPNKGWSEEKTLTSAAHGSHGGYGEGTAIWDEPIALLTTEAYNILKKSLIDAGIPIR